MICNQIKQLVNPSSWKISEQNCTQEGHTIFGGIEFMLDYKRIGNANLSFI